MMKKGYLKSLSAAMLATVMVLSNALCVSAETGNDAADNVAVVQSDEATSTNDVTPGDAKPSEKIKLAAPTDVKWGYNFTICFNEVPEANGYYNIELWKDGERYRSSNWHVMSGRGIVSLPYDEEIRESGDYKIRIASSNRYDEEKYECSDWVESPVQTYVRPEAQLGTTVGYWDDVTPGFLHFNSVEGAGGYELTIYYTGEDGNEYAVGGESSYLNRDYKDDGGYDRMWSLSSYVEKHGAGLYRVKIRALSADVKTIANGEEGEFSDYYDTTKTAADVSSTVKDALENGGSAQESLDAVINNVTKSALKTAMQTDAETLAQVKELENRYTKENNISVEAPAVSLEASNYVDPNKINMVGAGLNAKSGAVQLSVGVPEKKEYVNDKYYKNTVQLAIELKNENRSIHNLDVPVTITMPIPAGLDTNKLAILHYHEDGSVESVNLKNNGDGTVTFTVTSFSTFVFAEKEDGLKLPEKENTYTDSDNDRSDDSSVSHDWNDITVNVDWTAESAKLDTAIQAANGTNVNVLTGKDVKVSEDILKKLAGKKATLALQAGNSVSISISGQNNKQIKGDLNLTVTNKDTIPAQAKNAVLAGALTSKNILITENSPLQLRTNLHVGFENKFAGKYANLYYYDAKSGQMNLFGVYQINKDGQSMFALSHGGQYVVTVTDTASKAVVSVDGYTVVSGDTLSRIAVKLGTTLKALKAANPQIADVNKIHPGQVIKVQ